jgi:hypothetical protein
MKTSTEMRVDQVKTLAKLALRISERHPDWSKAACYLAADKWLEGAEEYLYRKADKERREYRRGAGQ